MFELVVTASRPEMDPSGIAQFRGMIVPLSISCNMLLVEIGVKQRAVRRSTVDGRAAG
jgi:hypothetical protein